MAVSSICAQITILRPTLLLCLSLLITVLCLITTTFATYLVVLSWGTWFNQIDHKHPQWQTGGFLETFLLASIACYLSSLLWAQSLAHTAQLYFVTPSWARTNLVSRRFLYTRLSWRELTHTSHAILWIYVASRFHHLPQVPSRGDYAWELAKKAITPPVYLAVVCWALVTIEEIWVWTSGKEKIQDNIEQNVFPPYTDEE